jgi:uncharacterized lipoprotein YddW (UPF0748 family)
MSKQLFTVFLFGLFFLCKPFSTHAQSSAEMRGVWIATVANIDWPTKPNLTPERQKAEIDSIFDVCKGMGLNAVFVQIRPAGDAFYPTKYAPWSKFLTGKQGKAPEPYYDPLDYMVKAAHKRRLEFHAWLNPYRATFDLDTAALAPSHLLRSLPNDQKSKWFFRYGKKYYFNPANPSVIVHLQDIVADIVTRYDVDGIHFDDYFYPYPEGGESLPDYNDFSANTRGFANIEDWRRDNVSQLVQGISKKIRGIKPYVKFGISPFGVWRNIAKDPQNGSDTRAGLTCYDDLYADVLTWMQKDWVDYIVPQLYWTIGYAPADYQKLVKWWGEHSYGKHVYIGHAAYKIGNSQNDPSWNNSNQTGLQIRMNRANPNIQGSVFYSAKQLLRNPLGLQDSLVSTIFNYPALSPAFTSRSKVPPATPTICKIKGSPSTVSLAWNTCELKTGEEMPYYFGIYRFSGDLVGDFRDPYNLLAITPFNSDRWIYEDQTANAGEYYTYVVTAYNRFNVESYSSEPVIVKKTSKKIKKKRIFGLFF